MPASLAVGLVLTSLSLASPQAPSPARAEGGTLTLHVVDGPTGAPVGGVSIGYGGLIAGAYRRGKVETDKSGTAAITWGPGETVGSLNLTVRRPRSVPVHLNWAGRSGEPKLPAERTIRLEPGITIGGVVNDEAGRPIAGATVTVYMPSTESDMSNYVFQLGEPVTDKDGRWRIDEAPADLGELWARAEHPGYREAEVKFGRGLDATTVMTKGPSISGVVTDRAGRPIAGAKAIVGHDIWGSPEKPNAKTDAAGRFTIINCEPGPTIVTVQADGFAPQFLDARIVAGAKAEPLAFRLEPGSVIRVRLVDVEGRPVAGAFFAPDTWRGHRSIMDRKNTDAEGLYEWRNAPPDEVQYDIGKAGFMSIRNLPLTAAEGVQTVTLPPPLAISGRVTEARTGRPIREFRIVQGAEYGQGGKVHWSPGEGTTFNDGRYRTVFNQPSTAHFIRVDAPGFKPSPSRAFGSTEGERTLDFALERDAGSTGVVMLPVGRPAAGVDVAIGTVDERIVLRSGRLARNGRFPRATTDAEGLFRFSPPTGPFVLVVAAEAGHAELTSEAFDQAGGAIDLQPWGRIEGTVTARGRPAANESVAFIFANVRRQAGLPIVSHQYNTQADAAGRFVFERVPTGVGAVARVITTQLGGGMSLTRYGWREPVDVLPGVTARVAIGGKGRPVVGRVTVDGPPIAGLDWPTNGPATLTPLGPAPEGFQTSYIANLDGDGRFRIDDVPSGTYTLGIEAAKMARGIGLAADIVRTTSTVTVPEGNAADPVDLGAIAVKPARP